MLVSPGFRGVVTSKNHVQTMSIGNLCVQFNHYEEIVLLFCLVNIKHCSYMRFSHFRLARSGLLGNNGELVSIFPRKWNFHCFQCSDHEVISEADQQSLSVHTVVCYQNQSGMYVEISIENIIHLQI
jgi:hypothetical protein